MSTPAKATIKKGVSSPPGYSRETVTANPKIAAKTGKSKIDIEPHIPMASKEKWTDTPPIPKVRAENYVLTRSARTGHGMITP